MKSKILVIGLVDLNGNGGDVNHFNLLIKHLELTFRITVCAIGNHSRIDIPFLYPKFRWYRFIYWNCIIFFKCFIYQLKNNVSVVYFRESGLVISPYVLAVLTRKPIFIEVNGVLLDDLPIPKKMSKWLFTNLYRIPKGFFASKGYGKLINTHFQVKRELITTVHLGYNFESIITNFDHEIYLKKVKTIAFVGNLHPYQGLYDFILGFTRFLHNTNREDVKIKIFGKGIDKPRLLGLIEELNIQKYVDFVGFVDQLELASILKTVDLCISPFAFNRGEPFSISALKTYDYLNARKPILTSIMDENAKFLKDEGLGDYLETADELEIERKLTDLLSIHAQQNIFQAYRIKFDDISLNFSWTHRFHIITSELLKHINS